MIPVRDWLHMKLYVSTQDFWNTNTTYRKNTVDHLTPWSIPLYYITFCWPSNFVVISLPKWPIFILAGHPWVCVDGVAPDKPLDPAVLTRLKQFSAMNKLKKMALRVSTGRLLSFVERILLCSVSIFSLNWVSAGHCWEFVRRWNCRIERNVQNAGHWQ